MLSSNDTVVIVLFDIHGTEFVSASYRHIIYDYLNKINHHVIATPRLAKVL